MGLKSHSECYTASSFALVSKSTYPHIKGFWHTAHTCYNAQGSVKYHTTSGVTGLLPISPTAAGKEFFFCKKSGHFPDSPHDLSRWLVWKVPVAGQESHSLWSACITWSELHVHWMTYVYGLAYKNSQKSPRSVRVLAPHRNILIF